MYPYPVEVVLNCKHKQATRLPISYNFPLDEIANNLQQYLKPIKVITCLWRQTYFCHTHEFTHACQNLYTRLWRSWPSKITFKLYHFSGSYPLPRVTYVKYINDMFHTFRTFKIQLFLHARCVGTVVLTGAHKVSLLSEVVLNDIFIGTVQACFTE